MSDVGLSDVITSGHPFVTAMVLDAANKAIFQTAAYDHVCTMLLPDRTLPLAAVAQTPTLKTS